MKRKKSLHILMLTEYFMPFERGGSEWSVYHLSKGLIERGHRISVFTPNYGAEQKGIIDNINIFRFPFWKKLKRLTDNITPFYHSNIFWFITTIVYLVKYCFKNKPDILHVQGKFLLPAAVFAGKLLHIPVVVTLRDYIVLCPYAFCIRQERNFQACNFFEGVFDDRDKFLQTYIKQKSIFVTLLSFLTAIHGWWISWWLRRLLHISTVRVAVSRKLALIYQKNNVKIDCVIYNSVDFPQSFISKRDNYIVFAGRLTPGKGIVELLGAFRRQQPYPWKLLIFGDGFLRVQLEIVNIKDVQFMGQMSYSAVREYLRKAQLVVVPSIWEEPFGRVALESLAAGTPVLATNRGALGEIVTNGETGIIVEPTTIGLQYGLSQAYRHIRHLQQSVKKQQRSLMQKYQIDPVDQYENLYYEVG